MAKAYVNKRDKFLWDNSFKPESTNEVPVPSTADEGKAIVVNENGSYTLGDVSTEDEIVRFAFNETTEQLIDCTFTDIEVAIASGKTVKLERRNGPNFYYEYNLVQYHVTSKEAVFSNCFNKEYLLANTAFYDTVILNFTNQTLTRYDDRYVLDHKLYDTAVAYEYNPDRSYTPGEYCVYEGRLHRCTNATTGIFVVADWSVTNVMREIPRVQYNYSTTEHVVGTWIDGKPVYEQTFDFTNSPIPLAYSQWVDLGVDIHADKILSSNFLYSNVLLTNIEVATNVSSYNVAVQKLDNLNIRYIDYAVLQYTKTTD